MIRRGTNLLLTGAPGCGKTTAIGKVLGSLGRERATGFLTREIRESGERKGFVIEATDGTSATLAHVARSSGPKVGRYRVDVEALETITRTSLTRPPAKAVAIIDEIGRMECCSQTFKDAVIELIESPAIVVATIARRGGGFIARVKSHPGIEIIEITHSNREGIPDRVLDWIITRIKNSRTTEND